MLDINFIEVHAGYPADPVTNLFVSSIGEREVSLSWLTGFPGSSPISAIEMDVFPPMGIPFTLVLGNVNMTTVTGLMPFREYGFSIVVVNLDGRSEMVNISVSTLSLGMNRYKIPSHIAGCGAAPLLVP